MKVYLDHKPLWCGVPQFYIQSMISAKKIAMPTVFNIDRSRYYKQTLFHNQKTIFMPIRTTKI